MSYKERTKAEAADTPPQSRSCPAFGCPNAASTSFDHGSSWKCFRHAKAEAHEWPAVTQEIREGWPATCNWNHPDKIAHEAEQSALRQAARAKEPGRYGGNMAEIIGDVA